MKATSPRSELAPSARVLGRTLSLDLEPVHPKRDRDDPTPNSAPRLGGSRNLFQPEGEFAGPVDPSPDFSYRIGIRAAVTGWVGGLASLSSSGIGTIEKSQR